MSVSVLANECECVVTCVLETNFTIVAVTLTRTPRTSGSAPSFSSSLPAHFACSWKRSHQTS